MSMSAAPIRFAGSELGEYRHVCAFFTSPEAEYRTTLPFIREGLAQGERAFHVVEPSLRRAHVAQLREAGIDVGGVQRTGQLEIKLPGETYLRSGRFDKDAMLSLIEEVLQTGAALGFPLTRIVAHAECVLEDWPRANDWIEYESRLNRILSSYRDPVICAYDTNKLSASIALEVLRTHPVVVVAGLMQENPFYTPPDILLRELQGQPVAENENTSR